MLVAKTFGFAKANSIDDGGMIEFIADDSILCSQQGLKESAICIVAGREQDGVVCLEKGAYPLFQLLVDPLGPTDEPHR